jgi:transcriptional regulator GlxA family with amidase domain
MSHSQKIYRIGILVFPGCLRGGAVVPQDVFAIANAVMQGRPAEQRCKFESVWLSARGNTSENLNGLRLDTLALHEQTLDALMVPGIDHQSAHDITERIATLLPEQQALRKFVTLGLPLVFSCSSSCLLAQIGALDGRRATTSWWLSAYFRHCYPQVTLEAEELIVQDENLVSAGGVMSYIDLTLWLVGHFGGEDLRQLCAKVLVVDANRDSQAPYVASAMIQNQGHAIIERARRWFNERLDQQWAMAELAAHCHTSPRTLLRRFQEALGQSPMLYVQQLRVERAKALLETTRLSLDDITARCGYSDVSSFSKIFKRRTQITPKDYRRRFGLRS